MKITDEAVEAGTKACRDITFNALTMDECRDAVRKSLEAALPHLSQGAVSVKPLDISNLLRHAFISGFRANGGVVASALKEWPNYNPEGFPAYDRILAALSPAPVGVTDEMVLKFITTSRDEDAGYQNWTEAVTAGLNATLASHEPAPTDTQEGLSEAGEVVAWRAPINPYGQPGFTYTSTEDELVRFGHHQREPLVRQSALTACQQEVERLQKEGDRQRLSFTMQQEDLRHLMRKADESEARNLELEADLEVANDKLRKMAEALEPFAEVAFDEHDDLPDNSVVVIKHEKLLDVTFTLGDFRRARATLGGQSNG